MNNARERSDSAYWKAWSEAGSWKSLDLVFDDLFLAEINLRTAERAALAKDPKLVGATKRFDEAKSVWDRLQAELEDAVKRSPKYEAVRKGLTASEREYKGAKAELDAAVQAEKPIEIVDPKRR